MTIFKNSQCDVFYGDGSNNNLPCEVRLDAGKIVVSYHEKHGPVVWEGGEQGDGHFKLVCAAKGGRATLHRFKDDDQLEGSWVEGANDGMWRINLSE